MVSLIPVSYLTFILATVLFTSLIKCVSLKSVLNVVSYIIICHCDGVPGRSSQDTGRTRGEKGWELLISMQFDIEKIREFIHFNYAKHTARY